MNNPSSQLSEQAASGSLASGLAGGLVSGLAGGFINSLLSKQATKFQTEQQKELMRYQWENFLSPSAQVGSLASAGLNPAAQFGNGTVNTSGPSTGSVTAPTFGVGTTSMSDLAQLISATAQAKKAGVELPNIEANTQGIVLENQRKRMENDFMSRFGLQKSAMELAQAYANYEKTLQEKDTSAQDAALKQVQQAKEHALQEVNDRQRDLLQKELENKDTEIRLRNEKAQEEIKTEKSVQSAHYASAEASRAQAANLFADTETKNIFNKFYKDRRYQHSFMSQVVEQGREAVSKRLVTERQAEQLEYMVEQAAYSTDMQEFTYWSNQVNGFVNTLGQAASQFYGAGALRELINLRKAQQTTPTVVQGFGR